MSCKVCINQAASASLGLIQLRRRVTVEKQLHKKLSRQTTYKSALSVGV